MFWGGIGVVPERASLPQRLGGDLRGGLGAAPVQVVGPAVGAPRSESPASKGLVVTVVTPAFQGISVENELRTGNERIKGIYPGTSRTSRAPFAFLALGHALSMLAQTTGAERKNATPHGDRRLRQILMVGGAGFEPTKAEPADLQSAPVDRFGIPPRAS